MTEQMPQPDHLEVSHSEAYNPHQEDLLTVAPVQVLASLKDAPPDLREALTSERRERARVGAEQTVQTVESTKTIERLRIDSLTGLRNKEAFEQEFASIFGRKPAGSLAVLYLDVRGLKQMNGISHADGDMYLKKNAQFITETLRPTDRVYRKGGDEFVVVADLNEEEPEAALDHFVTRIKSTVEARLQADEALPRDQSLGVYVGGAVKQADDTPDTLLGRADRACVAAKEAYALGSDEQSRDE